MTDIKFPEGLSIYQPHQNAPDFIKGNLVITNDFIAYFNANQKQGKMRFTLKLSKGGKLYAEVDTWEKPTTIPETKEQIREILDKDIKPEEQVEYPEEEINPEDIPF